MRATINVNIEDAVTIAIVGFGKHPLTRRPNVKLRYRLMGQEEQTRTFYADEQLRLNVAVDATQGAKP